MKKNYWRFILPSTLSFLLTGIYSIVDGIFVGKAMGDTGLAAINIVWPLVALITSLGTGIGMGASVMVSLNRGAGNEKQADRMEGNAFFLLFTGSLLLTIILYCLGNPLLTLLGAEGEVYQHALTYLHYILYGAIIQTLASGTVPLMRNRGASFYAMCSMACGCILNIVLDYQLILVHNMELKGAALATVFGQSITLIFSIAFYLKKKNRISLKNIIPAKNTVSSILKVAASPFGLTYLPSVTILFMNLQCLRYGGEEAVSAYAVLAYLVSFMEFLVQGVSDGAQPLLSLSKGKGDKKALQSYTVWTFTIGISLGLVSGLLVYLLRYQIPVFYGTSDRAAALIVHSAPAFALVMALYGLTKPSVSYFYATEALFFSSFLVYGEIVLTLVAIFALPLFFHLDGVWYTMPSVQIILGILSILFLIIRKRKDDLLS
ncbi:MAG: MATE family efflux transporter [Suilimivivens sp.]